MGVHLQDGGLFGDVAAGESTDLGVCGVSQLMEERGGGAQEVVIGGGFNGSKEMGEEVGEVLF